MSSPDSSKISLEAEVVFFFLNDTGTGILGPCSLGRGSRPHTERRLVESQEMMRIIAPRMSMRGDREDHDTVKHATLHFLPRLEKLNASHLFFRSSSVRNQRNQHSAGASAFSWSAGSVIQAFLALRRFPSALLLWLFTRLQRRLELNATTKSK